MIALHPTISHIDIPLAASHPHFYGGRPTKLSDRIRGMNPNKEEHGSYIIVEPITGVPINQCARSQSNVVTPKFQGFLQEIQLFSDMAIPTFWVEYVIDLIDYDKLSFYKYNFTFQFTVPQRTDHRDYSYADHNRSCATNIIEHSAGYILADGPNIGRFGRQQIHVDPICLHRCAQPGPISITKTTFEIHQCGHYIQ